MEKLNRALILSTKKTVLSEDFIAFAADDPTLDRLHPLAKAFASTLYQIPGLDENAIQDLRRKGLKTCWLSGSVQATREDDNYALEETVHHVIERKIGKLQLSLVFAAHGDAFFCSRPSKFMHSARLDKLTSDFVLTSQNPILDYWKQYADANPVSYPDDSGDQIGGFSASLVKINGLDVLGPTFSNNGVESTWDNLCEEFGDETDPDNPTDSFCPFHYMSTEMACSLGLVLNKSAQSASIESARTLGYPNWLPLSMRGKRAWIAGDDLETSFRNGVVVLDSLDKLRFSIGPDCDWSPENAFAKPIYSLPFTIGSKSGAKVTELLNSLAKLVG